LTLFLTNVIRKKLVAIENKIKQIESVWDFVYVRKSLGEIKATRFPKRACMRTQEGKRPPVSDALSSTCAAVKCGSPQELTVFRTRWQNRSPLLVLPIMPSNNKLFAFVLLNHKRLHQGFGGGDAWPFLLALCLSFRSHSVSLPGEVSPKYNLRAAESAYFDADLWLKPYV
jgi:hypothetical protein